MPNCSGHGVCEDGVCVCIKGYKGEFCQEGKWWFRFQHSEFCRQPQDNSESQNIDSCSNGKSDYIKRIDTTD